MAQKNALVCNLGRKLCCYFGVELVDSVACNYTIYKITFIAEVGGGQSTEIVLHPLFIYCIEHVMFYKQKPAYTF